VDGKVRELLTSVGQVGDQRLLLMAAVLITDELFEARARQDAHAKKAGDLASAHEEISDKLDQSETLARESLEAAAKRVEALTAKLSAA
jgi:cell division protein ZapA